MKGNNLSLNLQNGSFPTESLAGLTEAKISVLEKIEVALRALDEAAEISSDNGMGDPSDWLACMASDGTVSSRLSNLELILNQKGFRHLQMMSKQQSIFQV